jgi:hypothetical protein
MNAIDRSAARTNKILGYLSIEKVTCPEEIERAARELNMIGIKVSVIDLHAALSQAGSFRNPVTGMLTVPGGHQPDFGYDNVQDDLREITGLKGPALWAAWSKVKAHLRVRWAAGNYTQPAPHILRKWAA